MKTSPTPAAPHARVLRFFFSHRERNGRKRDGELENSLGRDREKEKEARRGGEERARRREHAASISNPADCQMTRGMVLPLAAVLPSFSTAFLLLPLPLL